MSLLIKALDKAEKAQAEAAKQAQAKKRGKEDQTESATHEAGAELTLSPPEAQLSEEPSEAFASMPASVLESAAVAALQEDALDAIETPAQKPAYQAAAGAAKHNAVNQGSGKPNSTKTSSTNTSSAKTSSATQTQAANVFSAKRVEASHQNTKLAMIAGAGLIALLAIAVYYYQFLNVPEVKMPPVRPTQIAVVPNSASAPSATLDSAPQQAQQQVETASQSPTATQTAPVPELQAAPVPDTTEVFEPREPANEPKVVAQKRNKKQAADVLVDTETTLDENEALVTPSKKTAKSNMVKLDKAIASESASIQVTQSKPQDAVSPLVLRAYEAYNAGKDAEAQKLYKQALQRDGLNVDALLGLGAIATRQARTADAAGWYRKVLELDPKNSTALAAMADVQLQNGQQDAQFQDPQTSESRIKSMLAKSPNDANLHATLGNFYADQNQWPAAQQAYFDAFRLNANADNAFNLAVSLDQMGKPKLALPYYQQALQLAQQTGTSHIDKAALQARIAAIQ